MASFCSRYAHDNNVSWKKAEEHFLHLRSQFPLHPRQTAAPTKPNYFTSATPSEARANPVVEDGQIMSDETFACEVETVEEDEAPLPGVPGGGKRSKPVGSANRQRSRKETSSSTSKPTNAQKRNARAPKKNPVQNLLQTRSVLMSFMMTGICRTWKTGDISQQNG